MRVEAVRLCEGVRFWVYVYFSHRANHTRCASETKREVQKDCKVLGLSQWQDGVAVNLGKGSGQRCSLSGPIRSSGEVPRTDEVPRTGEVPATHPRGEIKKE